MQVTNASKNYDNLESYRAMIVNHYLENAAQLAIDAMHNGQTTCPLASKWLSKAKMCNQCVYAEMPVDNPVFECSKGCDEYGTGHCKFVPGYELQLNKL